MKRSFLVLLALTLITAGPALADCHPGHTAGCDAKASMAGCGGAAGCGASMAGCGPTWVARGSAPYHVSHDPGHVWYRGPAPSSTLFGEMKGDCGSRCATPCGTAAKAGACGTPCTPAQMAACGGVTCGSAQMTACGPTHSRAQATHSCCDAPTKVGCWHTTWKAKRTTSSAPSGCCGG